MTIQGVFLSDKEGKLLFYRNYSDLQHPLFEDFAFSLNQKIKLDSQHTFSIHGQNRLIYLPIETIWLVLVTTIHSNIIENIQTVQMMKDVVYRILGSKHNDEGVFENSFNLAFAFDDMVNLNMRNSVNQSQIMALLEMDSNNEKQHNAMMEQRAQEQKQKIEAEVVKIERSKKVQEIIQQEMKNIDDSINDYYKTNKIQPDTSQDIKNLEQKFQPQKTTTNTNNTIQQSGLKLKGMKLGEKKNQKKNLSSMFNFPQPEKNLSQQQNQVQEISQPEQTKTYNPLGEDMQIKLNEIISGKINSQGEVQSFELKGSLSLFILNENLSKFEIKCQTNPQKYFNVKLPPNFDKQKWNKGIIALKQKSSNLQTNQWIDTLKYNLTLKQFEECVPFNLTFWFSGKEFSCELEMNTEQQLFKSINGMSILFRNLKNQNYQVTQLENSNEQITDDYLEWKIDVLTEENSMASMILEFQNNITNQDIFPAEIQIETENIIFDFDIENITDENDRVLKIEFEKKLKAVNFLVE